ncbi:hypothetical protein EVAR_82594_1 [Eumeta japonica]|uniref:Uncharacterized protein n=1 Tax=Eumeta variegata TaxID=151549 RepID=A0A4C1X6R3_EUMVA|nr:hypothetical protein EVAR_82594_1 [Eumeta japonica]
MHACVSACVRVFVYMCETKLAGDTRADDSTLEITCSINKTVYIFITTEHPRSGRYLRGYAPHFTFEGVEISCENREVRLGEKVSMSKLVQYTVTPRVLPEYYPKPMDGFDRSGSTLEDALNLTADLKCSCETPPADDSGPECDRLLLGARAGRFVATLGAPLLATKGSKHK